MTILSSHIPIMNDPSRKLELWLPSKDIKIQIIITAHLLRRIKPIRPRLRNLEPHPLQHTKPTLFGKEGHVRMMLHEDRLDAVRTGAIRIILVLARLAILGAKDAQKHIPTGSDPVEYASRHSGDARAVEAEEGENGRGTGEAGRCGGIIEHVALFKGSLGHLLLAQFDHGRGEIDTDWFATALGDEVRDGLAGPAAAVEDGGVGREEVEEVLDHVLQAGIMSVSVFVLLSKLAVEVLDRHACAGVEGDFQINYGHFGAEIDEDLV